MDGNTKKGAVFSSIVSQWFHITGFWTGLVILLPLGFSPDSSVFLSAASWLLIVFLWTRFLCQIKYISSRGSRMLSGSGSRNERGVCGEN